MNNLKKIVCKDNYYHHRFNNSLIFIKGEMYIVSDDDIFGNCDIVYVINSKDDMYFQFLLNQNNTSLSLFNIPLYDVYFYTVEEERKIKIKQIIS